MVSPATCAGNLHDGGRLSNHREGAVVEAFCEQKKTAGVPHLIRTIARRIGTLLAQESIALAVNGRMELILPASEPAITEWADLTPGQCAEKLCDRSDDAEGMKTGTCIRAAPC